jgi:quinol monooxygenase YgiN
MRVVAKKREVTTMKFLFLSFILPQLALAATAAAPEPLQPVHVVVYVDVLASAAPRAAAALKAYRTESRREPGASGIDVFAQEGRASGFAIVEVWGDSAALETHGKAAASERLRREMKAMQLAPLDVRVHTAYSLGSAAALGPHAITLLVHVDVLPPLSGITTESSNPIPRVLAQNRVCSV